jgi:hypothetical protein
MRVLLRAIATGAVLALVVAATSCGTGRAIVTVDILSFIEAQTLGDTVPYLVPGNTQGSGDHPAFSAPLLEGVAKSAVDSVQISVGADLINYSGGPGTVSFITFFGNDSATVFSSANSDTSSGTVSGIDTLLVGHGFRTFVRANDSTFTVSKVWVGIRASVNNTSATPMQGRAQIGVLQLRVFLKDKLF